jgi:hypothetical protein
MSLIMRSAVILVTAAHAAEAVKVERGDWWSSSEDEKPPARARPRNKVHDECLLN